VLTIDGYAGRIIFMDIKKIFSEKSVEESLSIIIDTFNRNEKKPVVIAIGGPGGVGKSVLAKNLKKYLVDSDILELDNYKTPREDREKQNIYGSHPEANNFTLLGEHLSSLKNRQSIDSPLYDIKSGSVNKTIHFKSCNKIILDGEVSTYAQLKDYVDFSVYIDSHWKTQLNTRIGRDMDKRGFNIEKAISVFLFSNLREHKEFGYESKERADVVLFCEENYLLKLNSIGERIRSLK